MLLWDVLPRNWLHFVKRWLSGRSSLHLGNEAVSLARNRLNIALAILAIVKCVAQLGDIVIEIVFFDDAIRPEPLHQLIFAEKPPVILHENTKRVENLRTKRNNFAGAQ